MVGGSRALATTAMVTIALVVTGVVIPPAAQAHLGNTLDTSVSSGIAGERLTLSGHLKTHVSRRVVVQRRAGSSWKRVGRGHTRRDGTFRWAGRIRATTTFYRVRAPRARAHGTVLPVLTTSIARVRTDRQTSRLTAPGTAQAGDQFQVQAVFSPSRPRRPIAFQQKVGTSWVSVGTRTETDGGLANVDLTGVAGKHVYRAIAARFHGAPALLTRTVTVKVAMHTGPPAPTGLRASAEYAAAHLSWDPVSDQDLAGYAVYEATSAGGPWTDITDTPIATTGYDVTGLMNGTTYYFAVTSVSTSTVQSDRSDPVSVTPQASLDPSLTSVTSVHVDNVGTDSITLSWTNPSDAGFAGVMVRRVEGDTPPATASDGTQAVVTQGAADQWTDTGLQHGHTYSYALFADDGGPGYAAPATIPRTIPQQPSVTGTVRDVDGNPVANVTVEARDDQGAEVARVVTSDNGSYAVAGLAPGGYTVCFDPTAANLKTQQTGYLPQCWDDSDTPTVVQIGTDVTTGVDATLDWAGSVSGTVKDDDAPVSGATVTIATPGGEPVSYAQTGAAGGYSVAGLDAGSYTMCVDPSTSDTDATLAVQCYDGVDPKSTPTSVSVQLHQVTTGIDAHLQAAGLPQSDAAPGHHAVRRSRGDGVQSAAAQDAGEIPSTRLRTVACRDVLFLAARGSGESGPGGAKDDPADPDRGVGGPVMTAYNAFTSSLKDGRTVTPPISVSYPADNVYTPVIVDGAYVRDLDHGVIEARRALTARAEQCPNERILLAGFSQGAMIMHRLLNNDPVPGSSPLPDSIRDRIDASILIGDGDRVSNDTTQMYGSAPNSAYGLGTHFPGFSDALNMKLPVRVGVQTFSVCNAHDPVCDLDVPWECAAGIGLSVAAVAACAIAEKAADVVAVHLAYDGSKVVREAAADAASWEETIPAVGGEEVYVAGTAGDALTQHLSSTIDPSNYRSLTWSAPSGTLTAGLSLSAGGTLTGTPAVTDDRDIQLTLTTIDPLGVSSSIPVVAHLDIVGEGAFPLSVTPGSVTDLKVWQPVSIQLAATGGTAPYTWELTNGPTAGLSVTGNGLLEGTVDWTGDFQLSITVTDAAGKTGTASVAFSVAYGDQPSVKGTVTRLTAGNDSSFVEDLSSDGKWVVVGTSATNLSKDPDCATYGGLFLISTATDAKTCLGDNVGNGRITADDRYVIYADTSPTSGHEQIDRYSIADGTTQTLVASDSTDLYPEAVSGDGSVIAYASYIGQDGALGAYHLYTYDVGRGTSTEISTNPALDYQSGASLSKDGSTLTYTASPVGSNLVPYIHVQSLADHDDQTFQLQTDNAPDMSGDGSFVAFETYHGFFNPGQAILHLRSGGVDYLDGGVNGVWDAAVPFDGTCMAVASWEQYSLTADQPNRGLSDYYTDIFAYNATSKTYVRVTNTFAGSVDDGGGFHPEAYASSGCSSLAFSASPQALLAQGTSWVSDVYVTRLGGP
jgi:Cutinase/Carboxypeptidase regulatory-like domain/Fibronectin type III domain